MRQAATSFLLLLLSFFFTNAQSTYQRTLLLMGSRFDITVVAADSAQGNIYIDAAVKEIGRIEKLISSWDETSQTSAINQKAGEAPVKVDQELIDLIKRCLLISELTDGSFDISYASMDRIWKFDGSMTAMPSPEEVEKSVALVGYKNIVLNEDSGTVYLKLHGMKIGFGAVGKGYAADRAKDVLLKMGAPAGIINASGDMNTWGKRPDGSQWKVAIVNPFDKKKVFAILPIEEGAVVTSGNYEKYVNFEGKRYSHIIDPRSGYPVSDIISCSVFAPSAELADALATSVFVMGVETGIDRINQLPGVECVVIDEKGKIHTSAHLKIDKHL